MSLSNLFRLTHVRRFFIPYRKPRTSKASRGFFVAFEVRGWMAYQQTNCAGMLEPHENSESQPLPLPTSVSFGLGYKIQTKDHQTIREGSLPRRFVWSIGKISQTPHGSSEHRHRSCSSTTWDSSRYIRGISSEVNQGKYQPSFEKEISFHQEDISGWGSLECGIF